MTKQLLIGQTLGFSGNPLIDDWADAVAFDSAGGVLIEGARIVEVGNGAALKAAHPDAVIADYGDRVISAGFVDAHMHYPQTGIIAMAMIPVCG